MPRSTFIPCDLNLTLCQVGCFYLSPFHFFSHTLSRISRRTPNSLPYIMHIYLFQTWFSSLHIQTCKSTQK
jgi:hypothetical protein